MKKREFFSNFLKGLQEGLVKNKALSRKNDGLLEPSNQHRIKLHLKRQLGMQ